MKGYIANIERLTVDNDAFRKVLYTGTGAQLVLMSILPGEEIGEEVHDVDQFLRIERGSGSAVIDGVEHAVADGSAIVVPAGARHNIMNGMSGPMKLYTLYSPPHHRDGTMHATKAAAEADTDDEFEGATTEHR